MTEFTDAEVARLWGIAAIFAGVAGAVVLHEIFFRHLWRHDVRGDVIKLRLFGRIMIDRIRVKDIEAIDTVSWWQAHLTWEGFWTASWGVRAFGGTYVVVTLSPRLWWRRRRYRMSPQDPDAVVRAVVLGELDGSRAVPQ